VLPFPVWTLRGFLAGVPYELEEASMMDGCSRLLFFLVVQGRMVAGLTAGAVKE
jgi:N,N'-diacetylchitobiose transport system permease protein